MSKFIGRIKELGKLNTLLKKKTSSLIVIRGRRRIGKSRLIYEFAKENQSYFFEGLPPTPETTEASERDAFATQMQNNFGIPFIKSQDWSELFWHVSQQVKSGRVILVFDEISWMGSKDPHFLGKLKNAWDQNFSHNSKLILILCGSVSCWVEENILSSTGYLGRVSLDLVLHELPLQDCARFWGKKINYVSPYEILKVLSVTGGVPKYLEEILPEESAESNIFRLCFTPEGLLFREFNHIFSDLFSSRAKSYRSIIHSLENGSLELGKLSELLNVTKTGWISKNIHDLISAGFISEEPTWNLQTKQISSLKRFRLSDNYLRFYIKYIEPNEDKIKSNFFSEKMLATLPGWETIMGYQFENLVLNNQHRLFEFLNIDMSDIIMAGPFFQRKNASQQGCQIDLLIHTKFNTLYVCEIKFSREKIGLNVILEIQEKISRIKRPKGFSIRPVLIHVNGINSRILEEDFFDHVVDFSQLLGPEC